MSRATGLQPAARLSAFYAAIFLVAGIQLPFWPVWLSARGLSATEIGVVLAATLWVKVIATPAIGAVADRSGMPRRAIMGLLAATALLAYAGLWPVGPFWTLLLLNLLARTAQSALMPLGDAVTLATCRSAGLDYGRVRVWGSVTFILASVGAGVVLTSFPGDRVLSLVLVSSALVLLASLAVPSSPGAAGGRSRVSGMRVILRDRRFWNFVAAAAGLQASHQVYYGFGSLYWRSLSFSDATIGLLWAEGVLAEILLFWWGERLLARFGPVGLMMLGGAAGILRWTLSGWLSWLPSIAALQLLHAFTFGASHLGAMHFLSRNVPLSAAASAQTCYAAVSSGLGSGLVMLLAAALYAAYGGGAYFSMAALSAAGLLATISLRRGSRG
jgi:PPP family 3-phenylpropionic acid transporter